MAVKIVSGKKFDGVDFGTAPGKGYIIGTTPINELLRVDMKENPAALIGVKYYHHLNGEKSDGDRKPDSLVRMTMLVSQGLWRQKLWLDESDHSIELLLQESGDFITWVPGLWHSWSSESESTMLTISFERCMQD